MEMLLVPTLTALLDPGAMKKSGGRIRTVRAHRKYYDINAFDRGRTAQPPERPPRRECVHAINTFREANWNI